jgi:hypothetical protein
MVPSAGALSGGANGELAQHLNVPLPINKTNQSPLPINNMLSSSQMSLLGESRHGTSSSVELRGVKVEALAVSTQRHDTETFDQGPESSGLGHLRAGAATKGESGSVDLGSRGLNAMTDEELHNPYIDQPDSAFGGRSDPSGAGPSGGSGSGHRPRESFDQAGVAAWEGADGSVSAFEGNEGEAGPGPNTIRSISAAAATSGF